MRMIVIYLFSVYYLKTDVLCQEICHIIFVHLIDFNYVSSGVSDISSTKIHGAREA